MWYSQINRRSSEHGLTLIEMVVVAPLIILLIGTIIVMLSNLTGDSLYTQEKNTSAYNVQSALDDIETSTRLAIKFEPIAVTNPPFGRDGSDDLVFYFDAELISGDLYNNGGYDTLILTSAATDLSPYNSNRQLIYDGPSGSCDSDNDLHWYTLIYFVDTDSNTLYKRTINQPNAFTSTEGTSPCATPYQRSSCAAGSPSPCVVKDEMLLDNVTGMQIQYFSQPGSTTPIPNAVISNAQVASITLTRGTKAGGEDITYSGTLRATRLNISN
jgi:hypothetical protein